MDKLTLRICWRSPNWGEEVESMLEFYVVMVLAWRGGPLEPGRREAVTRRHGVRSSSGNSWIWYNMIIGYKLKFGVLTS
jgi:hypothetical protein